MEKREPASGSCGAALLANRRRLAAKLLGKDEARRIAANIGETKRSIAATLLLGAMVFGVMALGAIVLWGATGWLWLVVHQGLH